jgi:hypothetical protein
MQEKEKLRGKGVTVVEGREALMEIEVRADGRVCFRRLEG